MGQSLSEPVTSKQSAFCQNSLYMVGSSCMQGWRIHMEDFHTHYLSLPGDPGTAFFAVYDGHGGIQAAEYAGNYLHSYIVKRAEYKEGKIAEALRQAFLELDEDMRIDDTVRIKEAGCTAVTVLIKGDHLYCANIGDSRAVASINGKIEELSFDHKPNNPVEFKRIISAGGWVESDGRVNGDLNLSRAFGDFSFKRNTRKKPEDQVISAYPDVEERIINLDWEFIVMACDGIWEVLTNKEVIDFVRSRIARESKPEQICEQLMKECLAFDGTAGGVGCDNMTVVIICFLHGKTYQDLCKRCASRCL